MKHVSYCHHPIPSHPDAGKSTTLQKAHDTVIYDGKCNFCKAQVRKLEWFGRGKLAFVSLHDPQVAEIAPDLTFEMMMEQMYVVDLQGNTYGGAAGIRYLSRRLPRLWFLAPIMHVPFSLPLWQWGYRQVAKRRYLIAGRNGNECQDDQCKIHFD